MQPTKSLPYGKCLFGLAASIKIIFGAAVLHFYLRKSAVSDYTGYAARWAQGCMLTDDWKTDGFVCLTWPMWALGGENIYGAGAILAILAMTGAWAAAKAMQTFARWSNAQTRIAAAVLIFAPGAWLWTSLPGKETLVFAAAGWILFGWSLIYSRRRLAGGVVVVLGMAIVAWVRPYLAAALLATLPFLLLTRRPQTALCVLPAAVAAFAFCLWRLPVLYRYVFEYASLNRYYALQNWGATAFDIGIFVPDFAGVGAKLPAALAAGFLRPLPHEPYPYFLWPMTVEVALFAATALFFRPRAWALPIIIFAVAYGAFVGLSIPHFGTLWRHKTYYLPWLWAIVAADAYPRIHSFLSRRRNDDKSAGR